MHIFELNQGALQGPCGNMFYEGKYSGGQFLETNLSKGERMRGQDQKKKDELI